MKYRLLQKIGTGGMAEVFHAVGEGPEGFERPFAIKRIHPRLSETPEFSRMFVDEARISARLVHPNIVQVFDFVQQDGDYYIVMEPVDGVDMGRVFRRIASRQESLSPLFCAEVARQVCRGLQFAHALTHPGGQEVGVIHRDVTPPNIMLDWNGTVKIVDFGIARAMQDVRSQAAEPGTVRGKVSYVAPELLEGAVADARSDLFSLAVVMHELLSGQRLFLGENDLETLKLVRDLPIPPPSTRNEAVKAALDAIVMRGLERNPAKRYQSAREMGDELEAFVMRRQFSMRALGDQARELFPAGAADDAEESAASEGDAHRPAAPSSIGQPSGGVLLDGAGAAEQPRRPAAQASVAALQPSTPPPPPPAAQAVVARPAGVSPSGRIVALPPQRGGFRLPMGASLALVAISLGAVLVALFALVSARRSGPTGAFAASGAGRDGTGAGNNAAGARSRTVQIALDSSPQGATVTLAGAAGGAPVGQTPLVLPLARGEAPVELVLTKTGFAPLSFRVIPNRDKDATASLERDTASTAVASATESSDEEPRPKRKRLSRKARAEARAAAAAAAAGAAPPATSASAGAAPAPARPSPGQAARDVAVAPGSAPRR